MSHPAWYNEWKTGQKAPEPAPVPKTRPGMVRINILTMKTGEFADSKDWPLNQVSNVYIKVIEPIAEAGFYVELLQNGKLWGRSRIDAQTFIMLKSKGVKEDDPTVGHGFGKKMDDLIYFNALKLMKEGQSEFLHYYMEETGTAGTTGTAPAPKKRELDTISRTPIIPSVEPYFKWMGSKRKLVYEYDTDGLIPKEVKGLYVEPLAGSVAVYLYMRSKGSIGRAVIGDENPYLIATLQAIRDNPATVARYLQQFEEAYNEVDFTTGTTEDKAPDYAWDTLDLKYFKSRYAMFHWFRRSLTEDYKKASKEFTAATFLFIIATCFNALIRFNSQLKCNSPFGQRTHVKFFEKKPSFKDSQIDLMAMSRALKGVDIYEQDYRETMKMAQAGDFVFLDPPYWPSSETASFKQYYRTRWDPRDFIDLSEEVKGLCKRGALVLFANADLPEIHKLFGFLPTVKRYDVKRMGSSQGETRGRPVSELAMANYEPFTFKVIPIGSDQRTNITGPMVLVREVATVSRGDPRTQLQEGDIILTRVSGTPRLVGTPKLIRANETWPSRADNFIHLRLTPQGRRVFVPDFLYYYIQLQHQRGYFERRATGSVQKFITIDDVKNLEYSSPGMPLPDARSDDIDKVAEGIWRSGMYGLGQDYDAFTKDPNRHTYKAVIERNHWVIHLWYEISKEHQQEISDRGDPAYNRMKEISARLEEYYAEKEKVEAVKWGETAENKWREEMVRAIQFYETGNTIGAYEYVMAAQRYWGHIPIEAKRKLEARGLMDKEFIAYFEILDEIKNKQEEEEGEYEVQEWATIVPSTVAGIVDEFYKEEEVGKCVILKKGRACDRAKSEGGQHKSLTYTIRIIKGDYPQVYCEKGHLQHSWEDFQDDIDHCGEAFEKKKKDGRMGPELGDYVTVTRADTVNLPQSGDLVLTARGDKYAIGRVEVYHRGMKLDPITDYIIIHPNRPGELDLYKLVRELNRLADIDHYKYAVRGTYPGPYTLEPQSVKAIPMGKRGGP